MLLEFSEFLQGIFPFCGGGKFQKEFIIDVVKGFIRESAIESCRLIVLTEDYLAKIFKGEKPLPQKHAKFIYDHRDTEKFCDWIDCQFDEYSSLNEVSNWLAQYDIHCKVGSIAYEITILLERILYDIAFSNQTKKAPNPNKKNLKLIEEIKEKVAQLPEPESVPVPDKITADESKYIHELFLAYGDAEQINDFSEDHLVNFSDYQEDLQDRRIDYFAAETIQRSVLEIDVRNQFDILKEETLSGVKDTMKKRHDNGYERMLSVMEMAAQLPTPQSYFLGISSNWISSKIKKGVCHHLVNDNKLKWVKKK